MKQYEEMTEDERRVFDEAMEICDRMHEKRKHDRANVEESEEEKIQRQEFFNGIF